MKERKKTEEALNPSPASYDVKHLLHLLHQKTQEKRPVISDGTGAPLTDSSVFTQALQTRLSDICEGSKTVLTCCMKGSCHGWPRGWGIGSPFSGHFTAWMARLWCILACVSGGAGRLRGRRGTAFHNCSTKNKEAAQKEGLACWAEDLQSDYTIFYPEAVVAAVTTAAAVRPITN